MREKYMNKASRDARFKALGGTKAGYARRSISNQLLHPQYVTDYTAETGVVLTAADCGFGNGIYKTYFSNLYLIVSLKPSY